MALNLKLMKPSAFKGIFPYNMLILLTCFRGQIFEKIFFGHQEADREVLVDVQLPVALEGSLGRP